MTDDLKKRPKPIAFACRICNKIDWADSKEPLAKPEHIPYRGVDIGKCSGRMIPLYSEVVTDDICTCEEFKKVLKFGIGKEVYIAQFIPVEDNRKWTIGTLENPIKFCPWCGKKVKSD